MAGPVNPLEELGQRVTGALASYSLERERALEAARKRFLDDTAPQAKRPRAASKYYFAFAAALAAVCLIAFRLATSSPAPLSFETDGVEGTTGNFLSAPGHRALPLSFSDGSRFRLDPSSRVRVTEVDHRGASIALENGALHAGVVHKPDSSWRLSAGPLTVRVTGTRFDLRWSALTEEFLVRVEEGSVAVSGPVVGGERPVRAGETLRVLVGERRLELTGGGAAPATAIASRSEPESAPSSAALEGAPPTAPSPAAPAKAVGPAAEPDWRELASQGSLRKAFQAAEASGFDAACRSASAAELLLLGDGARLAGRADRANQALLDLRKRYPSDPRRAAAAFALGKVAFDQRRAYAQAAEWFRVSLREQPGGSLAREAAGRLIEALHRAGDAAGARRAAEDYLKRYPSGPHADVARARLSGPSPHGGPGPTKARPEN